MRVDAETELRAQQQDQQESAGALSERYDSTRIMKALPFPLLGSCVVRCGKPASISRCEQIKTLTNLNSAMKRNSTIDDVAKAAGVARVTVSRVLNNGANVRPETRERVQRAVEELGYSVNRQARALASGSGRQILLIHAHNPELEPNSYYNAGWSLAHCALVRRLGFDLSPGQSTRTRAIPASARTACRARAAGRD